MENKLEYFKIGKIVTTKGLKGELKVYSHTDEIERFLELEYFYLGKDRENKYYIDKVNIIASNMVSIKIRDYNTVEDVQKFVQKFMYIDREDSYELLEDEMFIVDMIGMQVKKEDGTLIGILEDVLQYSANDVYVVKSEDSSEYLIPATYEVVPEINSKENYMIVKPIPGLLD